MPFSSNSGKEYIKSLNLTGKTILDIGCGTGTYRDMFSNLGQHWTAVEIWQPYVEKYQLHDKYDSVIVADVREWIPEQKYDVCFCGDILEHMTEQQAIAVLEKLKKYCNTVVVSIPLGHYPQEEYDGNPYEAHVDDNWTHDRIAQAFGKYKQHYIDNEIGVYVYKKLKIAVYAISKNEEQFVDRFCNSAKDADLVLIADTGSNDDTVARAIQNGVVVHDICISPWRFDKARDTALAMIPRDFDICISLDLDEVLMDGWRAEIERVWQENTTRLRYKFDWGCGISFFYEKIHHRHGYHWHHPVHEYPRPDGRIKEIYAQTDMLLVQHLPDNTKSRGQYMPLLELAVKEDADCPRNAFYHARELTFYARWQEAITALHRYLALPGATWITERGYAMRLLGKSHEHLGQIYEANKWYQLATIECPTSREPWIDLSVFAYMQRDWNLSYYTAMKALSIKNKELVYTMDPSAWGEKPYMYASIAAWNLGKHEEARQLNEEALKFAPTDALLLKNREAMNDGNDRDGSEIEQSRGTLRPALRPNQCEIETA